MEDNKESIEFICLGSSSGGNAFLFRKHGECVLVEAGFESKKLMSKIMDANVCVSDIKSVIVTHQHSDHAQSLPFFVKRGIDCYGSIGCFGGITEETYDDVSNVHIIHEKDKIKLTSWLSVLVFPVQHDVGLEAYGFAFLDTETKESILFINDTKCFDFPYKSIKFDYIFIECNHIRKQLEAMLQKAIDDHDSGKTFKFSRQSKTHLSLAGCKKFLSLMNLTETKGIFLMHLSKECCNDMLVKTEIKETFKIPTFVCYREGGID